MASEWPRTILIPLAGQGGTLGERLCIAAITIIFGIGISSTNLSAPGETVAGSLEDESMVDHSGNAVVKTPTLSLDGREPHGRNANCSEQKRKV